MYLNSIPFYSISSILDFETNPQFTIELIIDLHIFPFLQNRMLLTLCKSSEISYLEMYEK